MWWSPHVVPVFLLRDGRQRQGFCGKLSRPACLAYGSVAAKTKEGDPYSTRWKERADTESCSPPSTCVRCHIVSPKIIIVIITLKASSYKTYQEAQLLEHTAQWPMLAGEELESGKDRGGGGWPPAGDLEICLLPFL